MDNVMELIQEIYGPKPYKTSYKADFLKMYDLLGSEGAFVNIVKEKSYGTEYLSIYTDNNEFCMSDRINPDDPESYIDVVKKKGNVYYVIEHAKESIVFKLTETEFALVTGQKIEE